jgi:cyclopropane-fatty-acyl-phospholipid synthase
MASEAVRARNARRIVEHFAKQLDVPLSFRLWDGTSIPLGAGAQEGRGVFVTSSNAFTELLRRPSLDTLFQLHARGEIDLEGLDLIEVMAIARDRKKQGRLGLKDLRKGFPWAAALPLAFPLAFSGRDATDVAHRFEGDETGHAEARRDNKRLIQFHYDASNEFYALFLDKEMIYSCAYFTEWHDDIDRAQRDKLDHICRKLRLKPGERFLDIGCGWGALLCHAAAHYGVTAHGVTLSQAQHDYAIEKIARLNLSDRVTVELKDYNTLDGAYDKIASIGMYEHVGIANYPTYFRKLHGLLAPEGILLNHGITRRAKRNIKNFGKISGGKRVILKYIFPGSELDHIGHSVQEMESAGFEVQDVENLRLHYGRTCKLWHDRLAARREDAIALIGAERTRMWLAYLAGVTGAFDQGPLRIYQTVATKQNLGAKSPLPPTRADLYGG